MAGVVQHQRADGGVGNTCGAAGLGERGLARTAQHGLQAGLQLLHVEGLGDVVVGPGVQAQHAVIDAVAGGEDQHGQAGNVRAGPGQQFHAVGAGQAQVQDDAVHCLRLQKRHGLRHAAGGADAVIELLELAGESVEQEGVVFDNQYRGHGLSITKAPATGPLWGRCDSQGKP